MQIYFFHSCNPFKFSILIVRSSFLQFTICILKGEGTIRLAMGVNVE